MFDKHGYLKKLSHFDRVKLELGCGPNKKEAEAIGIDALDFPAVDIVGDVYEVLREFPAASVDHVSSSHFIEHVEDVAALMKELSRVLKPNGLVDFVAPHFSNPYYYSDPTHRSHFGLYTYCYLSMGSPFRRTVPVYRTDLPYVLDSVDLIFKSTRPFYLRHALKVLIGSIFNSCNSMKELYEENLCYLFPCYEVRYRLHRSPNPEQT